MRLTLSIIAVILIAAASFAQDSMYVAKKDGAIVRFSIDELDSVFFGQNYTVPPAALLENLGSNDYRLSAGDYVVEVDGNSAGRISSLSFEGNEFLSGQDVSSGNWGTTFWPSPQDAWGWPPPDAFDNDPAQMNINGETLEAALTTDNDATGLRFTKTLAYNLEKDWVDLTLTITNDNTTAYSVAPWLITRVPADGLTFCPVDNNLIGTPAYDYTISNGIFWLDYTGSTAKPSGKLIADGKEGWMAHYANGYLFVHRYPDVDALNIAPNEGDVEIYVSGGKTYIEIEPQGDYVSIPAGQSIDWTVNWIIRPVSNTLDVSAGSSDLIDMARSMIE